MRPAPARARSRNPLTGRPTNVATNANPDMAPARSTDGSNRVMAQKSSSAAAPPPSRPTSEKRRSSGATRASARVTLAPETTSRCDRPAARKSAATAGGRSRSSPTRKPATSARSVGPSASPPASTRWRTALAHRRGPVADRAPTRSLASKTAPTCRHRHRRSPPSSGRNRPMSTAASPASNNRSRSAAGGLATTRTSPGMRLPSTSLRRPGTRTPVHRPCGSAASRTVAFASNSPAARRAAGPSSPDKALAIETAPMAARTTNPAGRRSRRDVVPAAIPSGAPMSTRAGTVAAAHAKFSPTRAPRNIEAAARSTPSSTRSAPEVTPAHGPSSGQSVLRRCRGRGGGLGSNGSRPGGFVPRGWPGRWRGRCRAANRVQRDQRCSSRSARPARHRRTRRRHRPFLLQRRSTPSRPEAADRPVGSRGSSARPTRRAARFSRSRSARGSFPPAWAKASATREPAGRRYSPGRATAPAHVHHQRCSVGCGGVGIVYGQRRRWPAPWRPVS